MALQRQLPRPRTRLLNPFTFYPMGTTLIDVDNILEFVDEYTLYCHYLEFEPDIKQNYLSPLRDDDETPSFAIYPSLKYPDREFLWKDSGGRGERGEIIQLVKKLYGYLTEWEAVARIKSDFGLGGQMEASPKIVRHRPTYKDSADIRIRPRALTQPDLKWWGQFNISQTELSMYRTSPLYCYWMTPSQKAPVFAPPQSYVYRIYDRYQLYFPLAQKGNKFRNDLKENYVMGMEQLKHDTDTLIITKSMKDVMCLRSFGYEAVAPRSENTPMPEAFFNWADAHYKRKLVLFDNDMKHRGEWYPYPKIYVPVETKAKDISDFTRDYSPQQAKELLETITR